jgi:hypothetical protein
MPRVALLQVLRQKIAANRRLVWGMCCYLVLIVAAVWMLDGFFRAVVLFFFAILVIKTIVHAADEQD